MSVVSDSVQPHQAPVPGILHARILEWVAISFSNAWKWNVKVKSLSHVQLFATPWTVCSLPGSSVHGIFQARVLEWVGIAFSGNASLFTAKKKSTSFSSGRGKLNTIHIKGILCSSLIQRLLLKYYTLIHWQVIPQFCLLIGFIFMFFF